MPTLTPTDIAGRDAMLVVLHWSNEAVQFHDILIASGTVTIHGAMDLDRKTHWVAAKFDTEAEAHHHILVRVEAAEDVHGARLAAAPQVVTLPRSLPPSVTEMLREADDGGSSRIHSIPVLDAYMRETVATWIA